MLHHTSIPIKAMWSNLNISSISIICYCSLAAKKFGCFLKFLKRKLKDCLLPPFWRSFTEKIAGKKFSWQSVLFHATKFCWKLTHNPGNLLKKKNCNHLNLAAMERRKQFWTGGFAVKVANLEVCGWCSSGKH